MACRPFIAIFVFQNESHNRASARAFDDLQLPVCGPVTEQFMAFFSEKTAGDGDGVITLLEDEPTGD